MIPHPNIDNSQVFPRYLSWEIANLKDFLQLNQTFSDLFHRRNVERRRLQETHGQLEWTWLFFLKMMSIKIANQQLTHKR